MGEELNYLSIRRVFEKSNNQVGIDKLIENYIEGKKSFVDDPLIKGVELSESFIKRLNTDVALALVVGGAKPVDLLIEEVLLYGNSPHINNAVTLFKEGFIDFDRLFDYIFKNLKYGLYALKRITANDDIFEKLTIENIGKIKKLLLANDAWDLIGDNIYNFLYIDYIQIVVKVLERMPYDLDNVALAIKICDHKNRHDGSYIKLNWDEGFLKDFILNYLVGSKDINELLERLYSRGDYLFLFKHAFSIYNLFGKEILEKILEELVSKMIQGKIKRPAFAMYVFDDLKKRKIDIYNGWALSDRAVELDIYFICDFKCSAPRSCSLVEEEYKNGSFVEHFDELDGRYREALEEKEPEKPYAIKPTDGQGSNK